MADLVSVTARGQTDESRSGVVSAAEATVVSANEESAVPAETEAEGARATEEEARAGADGGEVRVERRGDETRKGAGRETEGTEAEAQTRERARSEEAVSNVRSATEERF